MSGLKLILPLSFTDQTLPKLRDDPILFERGSLMLLETNHPVRPMLGSSAEPGQVIPNLASATTMLLQPGGAAADYDSIIQQNAGFNAAGIGKFEKSAKNGVHIISAQSSVATNRWGKIPLPAAVLNYLAANTGHLFYASVWDRITRATTNNGIHQYANFGIAQFWEAPTGSNQAVVYPTDGTVKASRSDGAVGPGAAGSGSRTTLGPLFQNASRTPINAPVNGGSSVGSNNIFQAGNVSSGKSPSAVFYRAYIEDLTVSGRTYADVDAIDFNEYTTQVLTAGGRYYADTVPTDPTTYP